MKYLVQDDKYKNSLKKVFSVDVDSDLECVHPHWFCHSCYNVLKRSEEAEKEGRYYKHQVKVKVWNNQSGASSTHVHRGRSAKVYTHRPKGISKHTLIDHVIKKLHRAF